LEASLHMELQQLSPQDIQCLTGGKRRRSFKHVEVTAGTELSTINVVK
jgi:hypothetical protein